MASSGQQDTHGAEGGEPTSELAASAERVERAATGGDTVVTPAGEMIPSNTDEMIVGDPSPEQPPAPAVEDGESATEVHKAIPPLLTDAPQDVSGPVAAASITTQSDVDAVVGSGDAEAPTSIGGPTSKERIAEAAAAARERVSEGAGAAKERFAEGAGTAKERLAEGSAKGKVRGAKARKRFADAASEARGMASSAASEARERASNTDVKEFAHSTTSLIDTARPFFLAGCAALFAVLGFLEGDSGTAELFVFGSLLFVIGAAFSGEINAYLAAQSSRHDDRSPDTDKD